jgi:anti-sigma B factor antagonist
MAQAMATFTVVNSGHSECVVRAEGEIDLASAPELREVLTAELRVGPAKLIIDMAGVTFIDSTGLSAMIDAFKQGQATGTQVVLRAPSVRVRRVLEVSGLDKVLLVVVADPPHEHRAPGSILPWPLVDADGTVTAG